MNVIIRLKNHNKKLSIDNLESYKNDSSKLNFRCECGYEWSAVYRDILRSKRVYFNLTERLLLLKSF